MDKLEEDLNGLRLLVFENYLGVTVFQSSFSLIVTFDMI